MVKTTSSIRLLCLALALVVSTGISQSAAAQETIFVQATPFHRFITQNETLGELPHGEFQ